MRSSLLVSLCVIAAAFPLIGGAKHGRCCLSQKFTGLTMRIQATLTAGAIEPLIEDAYSLLDYDADLMMERTVGHRLDRNTGIRHAYTEYKDFKHAKKYIKSPSGCKVESLNEIMIPPCVAENFTLLHHYTLGSGASGNVSITAWEGPYLGTLWMNIHFIDATCQLMSIHIYGPTPDGASKLLHSYIFADIQRGKLSSNGVFHLPDSCRQAVQLTG